MMHQGEEISMLIGPSQSLLQALGSSVAPPEPVRLTPTTRAPSAGQPPKQPAPPVAPETGDAQPRSAAAREAEDAPRDRHPERGARLDIVV
jgi:hypothetical protein